MRKPPPTRPKARINCEVTNLFQNDVRFWVNSPHIKDLNKYRPIARRSNSRCAVMRCRRHQSRDLGAGGKPLCLYASGHAHTSSNQPVQMNVSGSMNIQIQTIQIHGYRHHMWASRQVILDTTLVDARQDVH